MKMNSESVNNSATNESAAASAASKRNPGGFTLIELLVVISIIGVLAAFTLVAMGPITKIKNVSRARAELNQIETALENYKAKYGVYPPGNQHPNNFYPPATATTPQLYPSQLNQLYYELSGVTNSGGNFTVLGRTDFVPANNVNAAYNVGGFINCSKGNGDEIAAAQNFLPDLKSSLISFSYTNNGTPVVMLITSVGGPDVNYQPLGVAAQNPFRYVYPGVNNPGSYDLWVQLVISGKTNLVCNWSKAVQINTSLP